MKEEDKIRIAQENQRIRDEEKKRLYEQGKHIKYRGYNANLGVVGYGYFDSYNNEHNYKVCMVGTTIEGQLAKEYKSMMSAQPLPVVANKKIAPLHINYRGYKFSIPLYNDRDTMLQSDYKFSENKYFIVGVPRTAWVRIDHEDEIEGELMDLDFLQPNERQDITQKIIDIYNTDRHGL